MTIAVPEPPAGGIAVSMLGISKSFGATTALADVDLQLRSGEVHALLGENGAGKTTLMRILAGLDTPDAGTVALDGGPVERFEPRVMLERGIALVQQHFTLVPRFTAGQNLVLAARRRGRLPSRREAASRLDNLTERFGLPVRNDVAAGQLSVGEQQRLELLRALDRDPHVLILDEPTAVLTELEADRLLEVCRHLADEGRAVVLISHRLREVVAGADRVTVLRTGSVVVGGEPVGDHDRASLARAMIGADGVSSRRHEGAARTAGTVRLDIDGVRAGRLEPLHLAVHRGEVVGVAGVDGNGQTELEAIVAARRPPDAGSVTIDGRPLAVGRPRQRIRAGVAYVAADRYRYALVRALSLGDNLGLGRTPAWRPRKGRRDDDARSRLDEWDVRGPRRGLAGQLSGGNAQKLVLARELAGAPSVILAAQPTRGLDPGAAAAVATRLLAAAASGSAVLWISAELDELLTVSDRLVVLCTGHAPASFTPPWDRHAIGMAMAGVDADGAGQSTVPGGDRPAVEVLG